MEFLLHAQAVTVAIFINVRKTALSDCLPIFFRLPCPPLAKRGSLTHSQALALSKRARDVTAPPVALNRCALRLAGHQSPRQFFLCGMGPQGDLVAIRLLTGLHLELFPSGLWRKSYDRHWHLMNDHSDRGCHL